MHQGILIDTAARTHRDRRGRPNPVETLVQSPAGLFVSGRLGPSEPPFPRFVGYQRWLLPAEGWSIARFSVSPERRPMAEDWYIEPDIITVDGSQWQVSDGILDVGLFEGVRYDLQDADEFAEALQSGHVSPAEAATILRSVERLLRALERLDFSGHALLAEFAPGLPANVPYAKVLNDG